jgi:carbamoyl-phosphate synthase large subunit
MFGTDTAEGLYRLSQTKYSGIVNLGTGRARKVKDIISILKKEFPNSVIKHKTTEELIESSQADTALLKRITNWTPKSKLENTIPKIIQFEKKKLNSEYKIKVNNILITSISNKVLLIKNLKESCKKLNGSWKIFGSDMNPNCLGKFFVDFFINTKKFNTKSANEILKYCNKYKIKIIIPTRDAELDFFEKNFKLFEKNSIRIMLTNDVKRFTDKMFFYNTFHTKFNIIESKENINTLKCNKYVVKEKFGSGSRNIGLNLTKKQAISFSNRLLNPLFQPYVEGEEFSVDGYCDINTKLMGLVIRKREIVIDGESKVTTTLSMENPLYRKIAKIISELKIQYHFVLQFILSKKGEIFVLECNARYGGASSISIKSGLKSFEWFLNNDKLKNQVFLPKKQITQVRHETNLFL